MTNDPENRPAQDNPPAKGSPAEKPASKPPGRMALFMQKLIRGAVTGLALILIGMLAGYLLFQRPKVTDLTLQNESLTAENGELKADVEAMQPLAEENETLSASLAEQELHSQLLSALKDVQTAQIAVATGQADEAGLALTRTGDKLEDLRVLLPAANQGVVDGMLARLALALEGLEADPVAAASDLGVLSNSLMQLENTLFTEP